MTSTNLPAGVWRDENEAAWLWCPYHAEHNHCLGSRCAACREYRRAGMTITNRDGSLPPPDGYFCGKAGQP